ncbi:MAG: hypothetical protein ABI537_10915 [Casimicrobiaceae bacterium]
MKKRSKIIAAATLGACMAISPARALAQAVDSWQLSDSWRFGATLYGYLPTIGVKTLLPNGVTSDISIPIDETLNHLKMGFFGAAEAQKGRWGAFTDILYLNVGASPSKTHDFNLGNGALPADVTARTTFGVETTIWTLAGGYRAVANTDSTFDVFAGARLLDIKVKQSWELTGNIGQISIPLRSGDGNVSQSLWNALVGAKGRIALTGDRRWYVPYYVDVGTGDSKVTWQIQGGVGYAFNWGDVVATWRYLDFDGKSGKPLQNLNTNGPQVAFVWRW